MMSDEAATFLVTGAMGCIGSWVLRNLLDQGIKVVATDLATEPDRPRLIMSDSEIAGIGWARLDVTDLSAVDDLVRSAGVTHIVHLAGLQIPFCKANPSLGAAVNVTGTANIFEAARNNGVKGLAYASSLAVLGSVDQYPPGRVGDDAQPMPGTLYGVYKTANENMAKIYWQDWEVANVGLRPYIVYGVGRDQGMTSDIAKAVLATAAGRPFHIRFNGPVALQYASDAAEIFVRSAMSEHSGAAVCNLRGSVVEVETFVEVLRERYPDAEITFEQDANLPFPADLDDSGLSSIIGDPPLTPLSNAIDADIKRFHTLLSQGKIDLGQLEA